MFLYSGVKHGVEIVEEIHHFHRGTLRGQAGKAHYVREVDGHRVVQLSLDQLAFLQLVSYNAVKQIGFTSISKHVPNTSFVATCASVVVPRLSSAWQLLYYQ